MTDRLDRTNTQTPWQFNAPPGWPVPSRQWVPPAGWTPDPGWPPAPDGWQFWVPKSDPRVDALRNPLQPPSPTGWLFRPPPGWPPLPNPNWRPTQGWSPDPSLPRAPDGWVYWEQDTTVVPFQIVRGWSPVDSTRLRWGGLGLILFGVTMLFQGEAPAIIFGLLLLLWGLAVWILSGFGFTPFVTLAAGLKWVVGLGSVLGLAFVYCLFFCFFFTWWLIRVVTNSR